MGKLKIKAGAKKFRIRAGLFPWAETMLQVLKTVVPGVQTGGGGMGSSDGHHISSEEMQKVVDAFTFAGYGVENNETTIIIPSKEDPGGIALEKNEDGYSLCWYSGSDA